MCFEDSKKRIIQIGILKCSSCQTNRSKKASGTIRVHHFSDLTRALISCIGIVSVFNIGINVKDDVIVKSTGSKLKY